MTPDLKESYISKLFVAPLMLLYTIQRSFWVILGPQKQFSDLKGSILHFSRWLIDYLLFSFVFSTKQKKS